MSVSVCVLRTTRAVVFDLDVGHSETVALTQVTRGQVVFAVLAAHRCASVVVALPITAAGSRETVRLRHAARTQQTSLGHARIYVYICTQKNTTLIPYNSRHFSRDCGRVAVPCLGPAALAVAGAAAGASRGVRKRGHGGLALYPQRLHDSHY